jgi:hypothetical protein
VDELEEQVLELSADYLAGAVALDGLSQDLEVVASVGALNGGKEGVEVEEA